MYDNDYRPLDEFEKRSIIPLFMRKSKAQFEFEDIAKESGPAAKSFIKELRKQVK